MTGFPRRELLRGLGIAVALPGFDSLYANSVQEPTNAVRRFVCVSPNYGMNPGGFFPAETGSSYRMPALLEALQPHRDAMTLFTNLDHPGRGGWARLFQQLSQRGRFEEHQGQPSNAFCLLISCSPKKLDEQPVTHRCCSVQAVFHGPVLAFGCQHKRILFVSLPTCSWMTRPKASNKERQFLSEDSSILDVVLQDAKSLRLRLAGRDQKKLDQFLTSHS